MKCSHFDHIYAYTYTCTYEVYRMHKFINFSTPVSIVELLYRIENDEKSIVGQKLKMICIFFVVCFLFSAGIYVIQSFKLNRSIAPKYVAVLAASSRGVYETPRGVWW